jgi:hypothetical protein
MMAFLAALLVMVGIGFGAAVTLESFQSTADAKFKTGGVRLDASDLERGNRHVAPPAPAPSAAPAGVPLSAPETK